MKRVVPAVGGAVLAHRLEHCRPGAAFKEDDALRTVQGWDSTEAGCRERLGQK